jgi:hypothetical protein
MFDIYRAGLYERNKISHDGVPILCQPCDCFRRPELDGYLGVLHFVPKSVKDPGHPAYRPPVCRSSPTIRCLLCVIHQHADRDFQWSV